MYRTNLKLLNVYLILSVLTAVSCSSVTGDSDSTVVEGEDSEWLIPSDEVLVGAGRDAIPEISNPNFSPVHEVDFLEPDELIIGIKIGSEIRAYPHRVMNYHEIVNDRIEDVSVAITFCPLTGSALAWDRVIDGEETTFGVSGLIFRNNLIAYDRATNNHWSQMKATSVKGTLREEHPDSYHLIEMTWESWKEAFPESKVLNTRTGFSRNYGFYPYGRNYSSDNNNILFPVNKEDDRLEKKALAHGIFYNSSLHVFPVDYFPEEIGLIQQKLGGQDVVIAGSSKHELVVSFSRVLKGGTELHFQNTTEKFPALMEDEEGNVWNVFGECISGPREGERLDHVPSYNAYWFAWVDFFGSGPRSPIIIFP
ncbi:MAG: DUF3179 domain-containing protein [Balneolaceae bacterium]